MPDIQTKNIENTNKPLHTDLLINELADFIVLPPFLDYRLI
jgi:hypothetical protein